MKKVLLFVLYFCLCNCLFAQYIKRQPGQDWGANEEKYATLGDKAVSCIQNNTYVLAIDYFNQMLSINCKNADRQKDYFSLSYCYFQTSEYDKTIEACNNYIKLSPIDDPNLKDIYFYQGFSYAMKGDNNNAILCFEKAISQSSPTDYHSLAQNHYLAARCYYILEKDYLAEINYKKAISYGCKQEGITIKQIETDGCENFGLGEMFYYYSLLKEKSYNDWIYLIYLSAKCGHPEGMNQANKYSLFQWSSIPTPSKDLFQ